MAQRGPAFESRIPSVAADHPLGNSVGAIGWPVGTFGGFGSGGGPGRALGFGPCPDLLTNPDPLFIEGCRWPFALRDGVGLAVKIVTWLILPVVICLSQRLSHACLSISNLYGETANGSLNQLSFI